MHPRTSRVTTFHPHNYRRRRIDWAWPMVAKDCVQAFLDELRVNHPDLIKPEDVDLSDMRIKTLEEAQWVKSQLNNPSPNFFSLNSMQSKSQNWQTFDFVSSNLGKGFVFYLVCDLCSRRAAVLYMPDGLNIYRCRRCHGLKYPTENQKAKPKVFQSIEET